MNIKGEIRYSDPFFYHWVFSCGVFTLLYCVTRQVTNTIIK